MDKLRINKDIKGFDKLNKEQQFFVKNYINIAQDLYNKGDKTLMEILKNQGVASEKILDEIAKIMLKYNIKNDALNLTLIEEKRIKVDLYKKIQNLFKDEYEEENTRLTNELMEQIQDKYNSNGYLLSLGIDFTLKKISNKDLKRILNHTIKGRNYSSRIWQNKNEVTKKVKASVGKFLKGEINLNNIEKQIRRDFEVNKMYSTRLVRNEVARVQNAANEQFFIDNDGEHLLYSATLDNKTCVKCAADDGKVFGINDNRPELPRHVNDRCTYILLPNKDYRPSTRIDNITKQDIDFKSYEEWLKDKNLTD
ncbi:minor capsid protein [Clostridium perfringens]|nr:minor capsid protein [Clostridium perfringens]